MKGRIFITLFALPFFGVGVWMLLSVGGTFHDAWRMSGWEPVSAQLSAAGYETHSGDDSDTYEAYATYSYRYRGRPFTGDRVALAGGADNIGDYQVDTGNRLSAMHARGEPITVGVHPDAPAESIIDRGIRWDLVGFKSIFLFVFGGIGLGLLVFTWTRPAEKDASLVQYQEAPWLLNDAWQTPEIRSGSKAAMGIRGLLECHLVLHAIRRVPGGCRESELPGPCRPVVPAGRHRTHYLGRAPHAGVATFRAGATDAGPVSGLHRGPRRRHHRPGCAV